MYEKDINLPEIVVMKKISLLLAAILASVTVSGCDAFTSFFGGDSSKPQDQQKSDDDSKKEDNGNSDPWVQEDEETYLTVSFNSNGGSGLMEDETIEGSEFLAPECSFTKEGYHFIKWALLDIDEWVYYFVGDTISGITDDIVLYAIWEEDLAVGYTVTLYANNGTDASTSTTIYTSSFNVPVCSFEYAGHTFTGWALGSPSGNVHNVGSTIGNISADFALYATWEESSGSEEFGGYYNSISSSLTGNSLISALHSLNSSKRKKTVGYDGMKTFSAICDVDPDGSGKIIGFYDNTKIGPSWDGGSTWNREHVWPNCRGGNKVEGDAHMTRPASTKTNSDRGSKGFGTESYDPGKSVAYYRGVASRIIFYAAIADTALTLIEDPLNYDGVKNGLSDKMGCLSDMLMWNLQYLPSSTTFTGENDLARRTELNRNEVIQNHTNGQGNRNPFIDHPEYACKIWGTTNSKTRSICGM